MIVRYPTSVRSLTADLWRHLLVERASIEVFNLTNANGVSVNILSYGGIIQSIAVPDRAGVFANIALGFSSLDDYIHRSPFFGCITGRYANRIRNSSFTL